MSKTSILPTYKLFAFLSIILGQLPISGVAQTADQPPSSAIVAAARASFHEYDSGATFDYVISTASAATQDVRITQTFDPSSKASVAPSTKTFPHSHIARMVMDADFVGTATTIKSWSYPTASNTFAFTIYLMHVNDVFIGGKAAVHAGQDIYIARAGGTVNYSGYTVHAIDPSFDQFPLNDTYVFFGITIGPGVYKVDSDRSLQDKDGVLHETNKRNTYSNLYSGRDSHSVLSEALSAWQELPAHDTGGTR